MMDPYGTHQRLLLKAALMTSGPILELGVGEYSTPLLHEIALAQNRALTSVDSDLNWIQKFGRFENNQHHLLHVPNWDAFKPNSRFGLAFIDHAPSERREIDIMRLAPLTDILVIHDTEADGYGYQRALPLLDHIETDSSITPWTTICRGQIPMFRILEIETKSTCNRTCSTCIRNSHSNRELLRSWFEPNEMPLSVISQIISQAKVLGYTGAVCLSHYNEPLLDSRLPQIAAMVRHDLRATELFFHSNGDMLTKEMAEQLDGIVTRIAFSLYMDEPLKSQREAWIRGLFKQTKVDMTGGSHFATHFSPLFPVSELAMSHRDRPCQETLARLILNHRGQMLMCCEDVIGNFDLGHFPERSLTELWWSEHHQSAVWTIGQSGGRRQFDYCETCPRP
jgi:hypothetical protein